MAEHEGRRYAQVAEGNTKVQYVVTEAWKQRLRDRAELLGVTMTDYVVGAVNKQLDTDDRRDERRAARGT